MYTHADMLWPELNSMPETSIHENKSTMLSTTFQPSLRYAFLLKIRPCTASRACESVAVAMCFCDVEKGERERERERVRGRESEREREKGREGGGREWERERERRGWESEWEREERERGEREGGKREERKTLARTPARSRSHVPWSLIWTPE
jgi:hypothetical protein